MTINICNNCLYPDTKPDLWFDEKGVCSACNSFFNRKKISWAERDKEFKKIMMMRKKNQRSPYDCLIPVSGGKDSTYQVIKMLELGFNPLCVTATTDSPTPIGRRNLKNIRELGVDLIEVNLNPKIRRKLNKICLKEIGDISWPEHVAIFTVPIRLAVEMGIRIVIWGENPQNEYGGPATSVDEYVLTRQWLEEFGGLLGFRVSDLIHEFDFKEQDLHLYTYPTDDELKESEVTGLFLGYFYEWDGYTNSLISQAYGFETFPKNIIGSLGGYENLDNYQTGIHDYFKFLKYGFGRVTDIVNNHIRRNRLTRDQGIKLVEMHDGVFPIEYLGKPLEEIIDEIGISLSEFEKICDQFTNKEIFKTNNNGDLIKDKNKRLFKAFRY